MIKGSGYYLAHFENVKRTYAIIEDVIYNLNEQMELNNNIYIRFFIICNVAM